jgi:hypothetical protein
MQRQSSIATVILTITFLLPHELALPQGNVATLAPLTQQLIGLEKSFHDAEKRRDRDVVKNSLADDFVSIGTDGQPQTKADLLSDLATDERLEYRQYNVQVVPLNDSAAVVTYDVIVRMVHYDEDTPRYQRVSSTWVKQGSEWKLKFQQATATQQRH